MICKNNDKAVSPVIGVILMVSITVILAAVIAAFVFGMAGTVKPSKNIAITAHRTSDTSASLTNYGGADVRFLDYMNVSVDNAEVSTSPVVFGTAVGSSADIVVTSGPHHLVVTGTFTDHTTQILLDSTI